MLFSDIKIDEVAGRAFLRKWDKQEYSLEDFTSMLHDSTTWHNIPFEILAMVVRMECGYPSPSYGQPTVDGNQNPYRVKFSAKSNSTYKGPFQMHPGRGFWDQILKDSRTDAFDRAEGYKLNPITVPYMSASLGQLLYAMVVNQKVNTLGKHYAHGRIPLTAQTFYLNHMWSPFSVGAWIRNAMNGGSTRLSSKVVSGQSRNAKAFFDNYVIPTEV